MKRIFTGTCLAAVFSVACSAYAQQPPPPTAPADAMAAKTTKLSGCLKAGADAGTFELATSKKDKMATSDQAAAAAPTSSQAPTQDAMAKVNTKNVKLVPATGVALAAHLDHQVEVSGSWQQAASAAPDASGAKTFSVTSVKMIAPSCTTGSS